VVRLVIGDTAFVTATGVVVGTALAIGIGSLLGSMLYEVTAYDPVALAAAPVVLASAALAAAYLPARRATRTAMATALRRD
jgi:ABC-type antimicrobial peptide transport system permease subunit